ncbi:Acetoacetyl-CoA reductase [Candidatus Cyrtobacter comes]|uniref:Acetoacetyl-CoA reductase n=1 Tax=Candidatus Cyrtobacter comes TaxID=675776 RepID=A0ABU5L9A6_9RICK|nr:3-oxoacyl-ACP reductase [Candidatus Cyrtobacter comes]MDZ5762622.1 Acetoacetyl-CoA reductase [Candidatus Cyrtobacter comes]
MRRVLITGGTRGIGKAIAIGMHKQGHKVIANYLGNNSAAEALEKEFGIKTLKWDIADYSQCKAAIEKAENMLEGNIEILFNNAGIARDAMLHKQSIENWHAVIDTNLSSVFNMTNLILPKMREAKFGRIVSTSSVNAHGMLGQTNYAAAKAGIEGFTKSLALEVARYGITANAIAPGYIDTEMMNIVPQKILDGIIAHVPMGRLGKVEEVAQAALFLASESSSFITGVILPVNGGLRMY